MLNNRSKLRLMTSPVQIRPLTECIATRRHALHFTRQHEHATLGTNRKEMNTTGRLMSKRRSSFHRSLGVLACLIHRLSHLNKTKLYILFFTILKTKLKLSKQHRSIYCTPLVHKNILGTLRFNKQQHFIIKKLFEYRHRRRETDEKHDIQMENRNVF